MGSIAKTALGPPKMAQNTIVWCLWQFSESAVSKNALLLILLQNIIKFKSYKTQNMSALFLPQTLLNPTFSAYTAIYFGLGFFQKNY